MTFRSEKNSKKCEIVLDTEVQVAYITAYALHRATPEENEMPVTAMAQEFKKITVRAAGKAHPALQYFTTEGKPNGFVLCCRCPGSQNGGLANSAVKVADGHSAANCGK